MDLSRALLSNWVNACCRLMAPLDEALYHYVMNCRKLHTDDTPVPVAVNTALTDRLRLFRVVCQNGLICGETFGKVRVPHKGNVVEKVI